MAKLAELHQSIRRSIELADMRRSRRLCEAILAERPDNLETLLLLAEVQLESGRGETAVEGFQRVLRGDPEAFLAYAGLAIAHEGMQDSAAAMHYYARALDLNPANSAIRTERDRLFAAAYPGRELPPPLNESAMARSLLEAGFYQKSVDAHRAFLEREPGRIEARLGLAESLWMLGGTKEPQDICEDILVDAPRAVKANAIIACVTAETESVLRGRELLGEVHAQDPDGRIAGYIISQTPLAEWATIPVDLAMEEEDTDEDQSVEIDLPSWTHWMRNALWSVLRLVVAPAHSTPEWGILQPLDPSQRRRIMPTGPIGRRIQDEIDLTPAIDDSDRTEIIIKPWPTQRTPRLRSDEEHG